MRWMNVRKTYPNQWLVIEAVKAHSAKTKRVLDKIAVMESCTDGTIAMQKYRAFHNNIPNVNFISFTPAAKN